MQYLNLETRCLHAAEYIGSDPRARGTWLSAMLWCAQQENSGRIAGAATWRSRRFEQTFGATRREIDAAAPLLTWEGEDLVVWGYPLTQQEKYHAAAERARINGLAGGRPRNAARVSAEPESKPTLVPKSEPASDQTSQSVRERNGKEGNEIPLAGVLPFPGSSEPDALGGPPAAPSRPRDVLFEALARAEGSNPAELTKTAARAIGVALAEIRRATPNVTASEIQNRAVIYRRVMGANCTLTASALAKHWARCSGVPVTKAATAPTQPEPAGWVAWLESNMPASDEDGPLSQLTAAKNMRSFAMMPASWQARCRAELEQPSARRRVAGSPLPAELNRF